MTHYLSEARAEVCDAEIAKVEALAETYRAWLHDLSWFMRTLNEHIARQANAEDAVKGRFWKVASRARRCWRRWRMWISTRCAPGSPRRWRTQTAAPSKSASVRCRTRSIPRSPPQSPPVSLPPSALEGETLRTEEETQALPKIPLMPFDATARTPWAVPFAFEDYLELVDWTGRALRSDERGHIAARHPHILPSSIG